MVVLPFPAPDAATGIGPAKRAIACPAFLAQTPKDRFAFYLHRQHACTRELTPVRLSRRF
jgi:hypothetical protein